MKWVLVDTSFLAYRACYAMPELTHEDIPTGVTYKFLQDLLDLAFDPRVKSNKMLMFFDSMHSFRKRVYPEYKGKRNENLTDEDRAKRAAMHVQLDMLQEQILPQLGFPVFTQNGCESDDLMASAAATLGAVCEESLIITADNDLFQCIDDHCSWFNPYYKTKGEMDGLLLNPAEFLAKYAIEPKTWVEVKAMAGCKTDNVAGIKGVGEDTAVAHLTNVLPIRYKRAQDILSPAGQAIIARNRGLVALPHPRTKRVVPHTPAYRPTAFHDWCKKLGMESFLKGQEYARWLAFFSGDMSYGSGMPKMRRRGEQI